MKPTSNAIRSDTLLQPIAVFIVNLMDFASMLNIHFGHCFIDPQPGIYFVNQTEPILKPNQNYFTDSTYRSQTPITSLDNVRENVLDENGLVVIPDYILKQQKKYLRPVPSIPVRSIEFLHRVAQQFIASNVVHQHCSYCERDLYDLVRPEFHYLVSDGTLEAGCRGLLDQLHYFMNGDVWNLYYLSRQGTDLCVEKSIDFRIYEWHQNKENGIF